MKKLITSLSLSLFTLSAISQAGTLVPTFGISGKVLTPIGASGDRAFGMAVQPDGKLITAGFSNAAVREVVVARFNLNGTLDNTFGGGAGFVTTAVGGLYSAVYAVALQSDGKIVVTGIHANQDFLVIRYNADGSLDNTFSDDGYTTTPFAGSGTDLAYAVVIQPDGKIVAAGKGTSTNQDFALVRYNTDGSLDNTFGDGDGIVTTGIGPGGDDLRAVALQADGKIIAAGYATGVFNGTFNSTDYAVVRYNTDGSLDNTFSDDGKLTVHVGSGNDWAYDVAVQADGKIVACGISNVAGGYDLSVVRINTDGTLDNTFGVGGKALISVGTEDDFRAVHLQADGKIVLGGNAIEGSSANVSIVRLNADGSLDTDFDGDGKVVTPSAMELDRAWNMTMWGDRIYTGGHSSENGTDDLYVLAFQNDAVPLPVTLLSFSADKSDTGVNLKWSTAFESNVSHFEVQRSSDARSYSAIGRVQVSGETSVANKEYSYLDQQYAGATAYYRLKMVDKDGRFTYSKVIRVKTDKKENLIVYPNPARDQIRVQTTLTGTIRMSIYNTAGVIVKTKTIILNGSTQSLAITISDLQIGLYRVQVEKDDQISSAFFIKSGE